MPGHSCVTPAINPGRKSFPNFVLAARHAVLPVRYYYLFLLLPITVATAQIDLMKYG